MNDLEYLEQASAHADEGPLGEVAARSILKIAIRFGNMLKGHKDNPRWIADMKTMELSERQEDHSYKLAYKMSPLNANGP